MLEKSVGTDTIILWYDYVSIDYIAVLTILFADQSTVQHFWRVPFIVTIYLAPLPHFLHDDHLMWKHHVVFLNLGYDGSILIFNVDYFIDSGHRVLI